MRKTDTINELASALSVAQGEIKHASMNATNPFFKSKYADLGSVIDASKEALKKNGLALSQLSFTEVDEHGMRVGVESVLMHSSGQWISERISLPVEKDNRLSLAQAMGAIISYLRRYSYASMLGIYSDLDTDGSETPQENKAPLHNEPLKKLAEVARDMPQKMSLEMAKSFTSGDNKPYWDMELPPDIPLAICPVWLSKSR